jgi:hypothetical protein
MDPIGDLHRNNPLFKKTHKMTFRPNYFTHLTLLCGGKGVTPVYVAPVRAAPHIVGRQARAITYNKMCGVLAKGATQKGVTPLRREPHKRVRSVN